MKKGITDIVQRLSGWGDLPDYEILEISDSGEKILITVKKDVPETIQSRAMEDKEK